MQIFKALLAFTIVVIISGNLYAQSLAWQQTNGPKGGAVQSIAVSPDGLMFAIAGLRAYISYDKGISWTRSNLRLNNPVAGIAINKAGQIFVCDDLYIRSSTDNGNTWSSNKLITSGTLRGIYINSEQHLFTAYGNNIMYSTDNGSTWGCYVSAVPAYGITSFSVSLKSNYFLTTESGVYYSTNNGASWINRSGNLPQASYYKVVTARSGNIITGAEGKIFTSTDKGISWSQTFTSGNYMFQNLIVDSLSNIWAGNGSLLLKSTNEGMSWSVVNSFNYKNLIQNSSGFSLAATAEGDLFAGSMKGLYVFRNGESDYQLISEGFIGVNINSMIAARSGKVFAGGYFDVYVTEDEGNNWISTNAKSVTEDINGSVIKDNKGNIYFGYLYGIGYSSDQGASWSQKIIAGLNDISTMGFFENDVQLAGNKSHIARSSNNGATWQVIRTFPSGNYHCKIIVGKNQTAYYMIDKGIYKSDDLGNTWEKTNAPESDIFNDFIITRKGYIVAAADEGLLISRDNGVTWDSKNSSYWDNRTISLVEAADGKIYVSNTGIVASSKNDCNTWVQEDSWQQRKFVIEKLFVDYKGYLYASTISGEGVYRSVSSMLKILPPDASGKPGDAKAILSWNRNSSPKFLKYNIYGSYDHYPAALIGTASAGADDTSFVVEGLSNNTPFYMVISAVDNEGNESFSDEIQVTPVPLPGVPVLLPAGIEDINVPVNLSLKWKRSSYAESYTIQLSEDSTFTSVMINDSTLADTLKEINGLSNSVKYYWRVKAKGVSGFSNWSIVRSFTTIIAEPAAPAASGPENNAVNLSISQQLKWLSAERAENYQVQLSKDESFNTLVVIDSTTSDTLISVILENGIKYFWRIRGINIGGVSQWSEVRNFTTIVAVPDNAVLIYPAPRSINVLPLCVLQWRKSNRAETYSLQLSGNSEFTDLLLNESSLTDTSFSAAPLVYDHDYFWRVKARNVGGETEWTTSEFRTIIAAPDSPLLSEPQNDAVNLPVNITLIWNKQKNAESYNLQISAEADFSKLELNDSTITDTIKNTMLNNNILYYWKLRAKNISGYSHWSEVRHFRTIIAESGLPSLASPENKSVNCDTELTLRWNNAENAESYIVQISADELFSEIIIEDTALTQTSKELKNLFTGMKYYWRVKSKNYAGASAFSQVWTFTTVMYSPADLSAENLSFRKVKIKWSDNTANEDGFILERKSGSEAGYRLIDTLKENTSEYIDSTVQGGAAYTYRIKSFTKNAVSVYSNEASVSTLTNVTDRNEIPEEYTLLQNYPNPFNPATVIEYSLPAESRVRIKIYNTVGEVIRIIADDVKSPGYYQEIFNASELSSGIYIYVLDAVSLYGNKNYKCIRKMILMK